MNKISKKIVALVTMAAFVLTLVPAAAFAATEPSTADASAQASDIEVTAYGSAVTADTTVDIGDKVDVKFIIRDENNQTTDRNLEIRLWAVDSKGNVTDAMTVKPAMTPSGVAGMTNSYYAEVGNNDTYSLTFSRGDTYTIIATAAKLDGGSNPSNVDDFSKLTKIGECKVVVNSASTNASVLRFWGNGTELPVSDGIATLDFTKATPDYKGSFVINGVDTYTIEGYAYADVEKDVRATNAVLNLEASHGNNVIELLDDSVKTDANGYFTIKFKMHEAKDANIYVTNDDVDYTIHVVAAENGAYDINTVKDGGYVLAGTDSHYATNGADFSDAVQFEITSKDGEVLTGSDAIDAEPAAKDATHLRYVDVTAKPVKSDVDGDDFKLIPNGNTYTLAYKGAAGELLPGEYTVQIALLSGENATATFNVAKYGTTQDLVLTTSAKTTGVDEAKEPYTTVTDEIALGSDLKVEAKYVDENGIKVAAGDSIQYGVDGKAVVKAYGTKYPNQYQLAANTVANESLIGTTIYVKAFDNKAKKYVEKELTVVDAYNTYTLAFDPTEGDANKDNTVTVSVVDADGDLANKVNGKVYAYVADQSNADAKVSVSTKDAVDGKGKLTIFSDKETTVDVVVAVKSGTAIYAKTLEYTVGKEDALANTSVVMTIGSSDFVVNNQVVTMEDAAPYVANDRTYVPFRALGEALGAEVEWDNDARTVTYTLGDTKIVMTIGEKTYTVNGEEKTMDVAPEITGERTYVPVRFVGEALGFKVTALYAADNTTASVVFQK